MKRILLLLGVLLCTLAAANNTPQKKYIERYADLAVEERAQKAAAEVENTKKAVKKINSSVEKTTLGDLDALAALKSQLESK